MVNVQPPPEGAVTLVLSCEEAEQLALFIQLKRVFPRFRDDGFRHFNPVIARLRGYKTHPLAREWTLDAVLQQLSGKAAAPIPTEREAIMSHAEPEGA